MSGTQTDTNETTEEAKTAEVSEENTQQTAADAGDEQGEKTEEGSDGQQADSGQDEGSKTTKKPWYERRISDLTRQRYERDNRIRELEQEIQAIRNGQGPADLPKTPEELGALADRLAEEKSRKAIAQREFDAACNGVYNAGKAEYEDFETALSAFIPLGGLTPALIESALATDAPHKVLYHLGKHPEEAYRVMQLAPTRQVADLVKLAVKLSTPPPAKPVSKAPKPIPVGTRGSGAAAPVDPDKMSTAEWMKWRDRDLEEKRKSR